MRALRRFTISKSSWWASCAGAFASMLLFASTARAEDTSDLEGTLETDVITTASKEAETGSNAPATSTTITAEDLRRFGVHTLAEALDFLSLGVVTSDPLLSVDVGARGVMLPSDQGSHFLLLLNGHALNDPLMGAARFERGAGIPMEMIDHIEIILGPGSVLYGSNAMLGVINVITKRAKDWSGTHVVAEGEMRKNGLLDSDWGKAFRLGVGAGYSFTLFGRPSELTIAAEYYQHKGPSFYFSPQDIGIDLGKREPFRLTRDGQPTGVWEGRARESYYTRAPSGVLRVISGPFELNLHAVAYKRSAPYSTTLTETDFDDPGSYQLDRSIHFDLRHRAPVSLVTQISSRVYLDAFDFQSHRHVSEASCFYSGVLTCDFYTARRSRWAGVEVQASFDWKKDGRLVTLMGVDGRVVSVGAKTDVTDYDTGRYVASSNGVIDSRSSIVGAYVQQTWNIARSLELNAGARFDVDPRFSPVLSPRVAAVVKPWEGGTLKAVFSEAFRAPTWLETKSSGAYQIESHDLRPEKVRSLEASIEQKVKAHRILFGVFRTWWTDLVELHVLSRDELEAARARGELGLVEASTGATQFRNISTIDNYGLNAAWDGALLDGALRYGFNATSSYARKRVPTLVGSETSQPLTVMPQVFGNAHVSYALGGKLPTLGLAVHYLGRRLADRAADGNFPVTPIAQPQAELRLTVGGDVPGVAGLSYRAIGNYSASTETPYVVGPLQRSGSGDPNYGHLAPIERYRFMLGLQYDFLPGGTP